MRKSTAKGNQWRDAENPRLICMLHIIILELKDVFGLAYSLGACANGV